MCVASSIGRAQQIILGVIDSMLRPYGLTWARYEVLLLLAFSREGMLPLGKMGARLLVHPATVTSNVDKLEAQGLVRRVRPPDDRRMILAEITQKGRKIVERCTPPLVETKFGLGALTEAEGEQMIELIRKIRLSANDFEE